MHLYEIILNVGNVRFWWEMWEFGGKCGNLAGNVGIWREMWDFGLFVAHLACFPAQFSLKYCSF